MAKEINFAQPLSRPPTVARRLNLSLRGVQSEAMKGQLPAVRIGNLWRFRREDIELLTTTAKKESQ
jgi:excisionase family DNA binding protein